MTYDNRPQSRGQGKSNSPNRTGSRPRPKRDNDRPTNANGPVAPVPVQYSPEVLSRFMEAFGASWNFFWDKRVLLRRKVIPVLTLLYIISPLDLIPAGIAGPLGITDDLIILYAGVTWFATLASRDVAAFEARRRSQPSVAPNQPTKTSPAADDNVVDGACRVINQTEEVGPADPPPVIYL